MGNTFSSNVLNPFSGSSIQTRHHLLLDTILPFPEETQAHQQISCMMWLMPLIVTVVWISECLLTGVFHFYFHPWLAILDTDSKGDVERIMTEVKAMLDVDMSKQSIQNFISDNPEVGKSVITLLKNPTSAKFVRSVVNLSDEDKKEVFEASTGESEVE